MASMSASPKPDPYHDALYQLASTAAESSASPHSAYGASAGMPRHETSSSSSAGPTSQSIATASAGSQIASGPEKKISCMECRQSKVKCAGGEPCSRCKRLGKDCYYRSHKRGRKSDSSKIQKLEKTVDSLTKALEHFSKHNSVEVSSAIPSSSRDGMHTSPEPLGPPQASSSRSTASQPAPNFGSPAQTESYLHQQQQPRPYPYSRSLSLSSPAFRPPHHREQAVPSSHWSAPRQISSATPTSDDPDEPDNLGLPTLSNPLKLLAHASDSARDRDLEDSAVLALQGATGGAAAASNSSNRAGRAAASSTSTFSHVYGASTGSVATNAASGPSSQAQAKSVGFGPARGKAFFSVGLFSPKPDNLPSFDPIQRGILTVAEAESLFSVYMQFINPPLTLLDPHLHTFDHVRASSALLLCSACWIGAKYRVEGIRVAAHLEAHIRSTLLPTILMEGFRSAEIAQAFVILATYHPPTTTLAEDRSWSYIGFGIRIASELDMNNKISVRPANREHNPELARRLRNRERTWLNLWLSETSLSQHMGRRPTLAIDPVVMGCASWHLDEFALPEDKAMVAVVQLRLVMMRNIELFENFVDISTSYQPAHRTAMQVEYFRKTCAMDLDTWLATWAGRSDSAAAASSTSSDIGTATPSSEGPPHPRPPQRLQKAKLYYWYARLILDTIALKCSQLGLEVLLPIYKDAYASAMAYLGLFVATMVPNGLLWGHNSTVVTPAYCAIFALRVTGMVAVGHSSRSGNAAPASSNEQSQALYMDIDAEYTFEMVEKVTKVFEEAGNVTPHRQGAAGSYAPFLATVLHKARTAWQAKTAAASQKDAISTGNTPASLSASAERYAPQSRTGSVHQGKRHLEDDAAASMPPNGRANKVKRQDKATSASRTDESQRQPSSSQTAPTTPRGAAASGAMMAPPTTTYGNAMGIAADDQFFRQMMQFQAGPSGVQTIPGQSAADGAVTGAAADPLDWDLSMLDGFLGESLFSDMSFMSGEHLNATAAPQQTPLQSMPTDTINNHGTTMSRKS
ncbi:hypothetical protein BCV70DRAFT_58581 [Testicularia cyperi]|uniref:Zn(2)-C6 fungal-type domain-containing protein n=1 Tax=Testicularia cyperi TaxID=1882483 RepID=A0A317XVQ9_9BASI|nr:hypothetical protein BCV70DRAFT_58581 [Testicularia cyperi]